MSDTELAKNPYRMPVAAVTASAFRLKAIRRGIHDVSPPRKSTREPPQLRRKLLAGAVIACHKAELQCAGQSVDREFVRYAMCVAILRIGAARRIGRKSHL
jgi:hypothetical protein